MKPITHSEYKLKLIYPQRTSTAPQWISQTYKETVTCATSLELLTTYGIHTTQSSASVLVFESDRERMLAVLALSNAREYTTECID